MSADVNRLLAVIMSSDIPSALSVRVGSTHGPAGWIRHRIRFVVIMELLGSRTLHPSESVDCLIKSYLSRDALIDTVVSR
jgi:hypothetical protein